MGYAEDTYISYPLSALIFMAISGFFIWEPWGLEYTICQSIVAPWWGYLSSYLGIIL